MTTMDEKTGNWFLEVLKLLGTLPPLLWFFLFLGGVLFVAYRVYALKTTNRLKLYEIDEKRKRAEAYTTPLVRMESSIAENTDYLRQLLLAHSHYISRGDSLRVIKDAFMTSLLKDFQRIAETSIYTNHYRGNEMHIELRILDAFDSAMDSAKSGLSLYKLSCRTTPFFVRSGTHYELSIRCWHLLKGVHESRPVTSVSVEGKPGESTRARAQTVFISLKPIFKEYLDPIEALFHDVASQTNSAFFRAVGSSQVEALEGPSPLPL